MKIMPIAGLAGILLLAAGCQTTQEAALPPADLPPMALPAPLPAGTVVAWKGIPSGNTLKNIVVSDDARAMTLSDEDGTCLQTTGKDLFPLILSTKWENCVKWQRQKSGGRDLTQKTGALWPLKDGNKMTFHTHGYDVDGGDWNFTTTCTVSAVAGLEVAVGRLDAYKVECDDSADTRTWYMAPGYAMPVKVSQYNKHHSRFYTNRELVSVGGK